MIAWRWRWFLVAIILAVFVRFMIMPSIPEFPRDSDNKLQKAEVIFIPDFLGPESLAFDVHGKGPYTGVADGRIMRWNGPKDGWTEFAHTSSNRSAICNPGMPPALRLELEHICGRPLGMRFDKHGNLYIADAYYGLHVVGVEGGLAKTLVTEAEGVPLAFTNDVEIADDGLVYFTDSSSKYHRREFVLMFMGGDESGRLLTFNPSTGETMVILNGLQFPNGIALSKDKSFLVMSETLTCRVMRLWLKGPERGKLEVFATLPGYPDNIRRTESGDFWVAIHSQPNMLLKLPSGIRRGLLRLPISFTSLYTKVAGKLAKGMIIKLSPDGVIKEVMEDNEGKVVRLVSEVEEHDGKLWLGSVILPQIGVLHES
ncbi:hypothetical protein GOP47_0022368 [Adiantum capillus-veneris]|uniref:Strictosidine synthase conserved region domain-containing protein n=1 Tax=Adiantum capillus-veneris TaxID=13818 RepID=A0A9D4U7A2_ADICA|nr:hypothetical protein GOP47_0022368 [Adiantum capillus-veneris]